MELRGKYNTAEIFTDKIDQTTIAQIINLCNEETFKDSKIKIMPDCHAGKGCTIGTTMTIADKIVPNLVGVDIGCGVAGVIIHDEIDLDRLDEVIRTHIPHGFAVHSKSREKILKDVFNIDLNNLKCDVNINRAFLSAGTLGGGNHFIELDRAEDGTQFLIVHTGSRNLGKQIAEYYQSEAISYCKEKYQKLKKSNIEAYKALGKEHLLSELLPNIKCPNEDLCYLEGSLRDDYLHDMDIAQKYAIANRVLILTDILYNYYRVEDDFKDCIREIQAAAEQCTHNYIDLEHNILRKGAISAQKDEIVLIPINMRDGIILGVGKGNPNWNYSAPHGAGRILSRGKAKQQLSIEEFEKSMQGIYTTCVGQSTLDESPQAYKPIEDILNYIHETVNIVEVMKPIYNFKSN